jgi:beta-N-acetylhexosaminidase
MQGIDASAGLRIVAPLPGPEFPSADERALREIQPAGIILFARNLASLGQTRDLVLGVREVLGPRTFVSIDQEGGRVNRLAALDPRLSALPDGRRQGGWPLPALRELWQDVGQALAVLGIDVDYAPVADLDDGPPVNAIGPRSFGTDPRAVSACALAVLEGLAAAGVRGCLKHFPGLGETDLDTHEALAVSPAGDAALRGRHRVPFARLAALAPLVMSAHAHYPAIDPAGPCPATFSRTLMRDWLREDLGFEGVLVSDDLQMGALALEPDVAQRARRAVEAGIDLLLFCHDLDAPRRARDELSRLSGRGDLDGEAWSGAVGRIESFLETTADARPGPAADLAAVRDAFEALAAVAASPGGG